MGKPLRGYRRVIALPDKHIPYHDTRALKAVFAYMADEWWDEVIDLGDLLDLDFCSRFTKGKKRLLEGHRLKDILKKGCAYWDKVQDVGRRQNPNCQFVYIEGNHEYRLQDMLDSDPVFEGLVEIPGHMDLDGRGIKWVLGHSKTEFHRVGELNFTHGLYINIHHAAQTARVIGGHVRYGHTHDRQRVAERRLGDHECVTAASCGCLCELSQHYMKGRPTKWELGFSVFDIYPDGAFQEHYVSLHDYKFFGPTNGTLYRG